ncbi:MAG TPA: phosphoglycolate phosphatase [Burkholderiaceae bacterium]|nr:phosphoglycolate phosphatase [Burkholderiaceae bacterium]
MRAVWSARAALIDLDGTLLDTVPDLAAAVNAMRAELGRAPLPLATVAAYIGKGAEVLVHRALTDALDGRADEPLFARGREAFYRHYRRVNGHAAVVFPGVPAALAALRRNGLKLACVTNKPREFTTELLARVELLAAFDTVISGDDTVEKKPHAAPLLAACAQLRVDATEAVMIGDSENDLLAARAAGCRAILVEGGYNEGQPVAALPADAIVETLADAVLLIAPPATTKSLQ